MVSFEAKIGWKMKRQRENKSYRSVQFLPDGLEKIPIKQQKNKKKIKKIPFLHHFQPKQVGKGCERKKIKIIILFCSNLTRNRKL